VARLRHPFACLIIRGKLASELLIRSAPRAFRFIFFPSGGGHCCIAVAVSDYSGYMDFKLDWDAFRVHAWYEGTDPPPGAGEPCIRIPVPPFIDCKVIYDDTPVERTSFPLPDLVIEYDMEKPQPSEDAGATSTSLQAVDQECR
jgi:hypothetical protein